MHPFYRTITTMQKKDTERNSTSKRTQQSDDIDMEAVASAFEDIKEEMKTSSVSKEQLHAWFKEEIDRKDKIIADLKKENSLLFRTAMRANERLAQEEKDVSRTQRNSKDA